MDRTKIQRLLRDGGKYLFVLVCGLILTFNPEGATVWVTRLLGWALVAVCALRLIRLAAGDRLHWGRAAFYSGAALCVGVILLAKPMIVANLVGRTMGLILMIWGISAIREGHSKLVALVTTAAGLVLVCIPAMLTNTLLTLCGIIMSVIAAVNIAAVIREQKRLENGDPNIIDAAM